MANEASISRITAADPLFAAAQEIRRKVFIEEQRCPPDEEWDGTDAAALHLVALVGGVAAGTLRYWNDGGWLHVGRLAVLSEFRRRGIARSLMLRCLEEGRAFGLDKSFLNAQSDKIRFYHALGYEAVGDEFVEAGIPHFRMESFFKK